MAKSGSCAGTVPLLADRAHRGPTVSLTVHRIMNNTLISSLVACVFCLGAAAHAQSAKDANCNRAAQDRLEKCQKRIGPAVSPVDPNNATASEQDAMSKHAKAWQSCKEKSAKRDYPCRR